MSAPHSGGMWDGELPDTFPPTHQKPTGETQPVTDHHPKGRLMRPPAEHYAEADRLLAEVVGEDGSLPFVRAKLWRAEVHAALAQCADVFYESDDYTAYPGLVTPELKGELL